jgi:hypothetical protein
MKVITDEQVHDGKALPELVDDIIKSNIPISTCYLTSLSK